MVCRHQHTTYDILRTVVFLTKLSIEHRQLLQSQGFNIIDIPFDLSMKTDMLCRHPDGRTLYLYPDWYSVPYDQIAHGTDFDVAVSPNIYYPQNFNYYFSAESTGLNQYGEKSLICADLITCAVFLGICLLVATGLALATMIISLAIHAPCGTEPKVMEISACEKAITKPDCSTATFNECFDENGDGIYEGKYTSGWSGGQDWVKWIVIAAVAIGGVYIAAKVVPYVFKKKSSAPSAET